MECFLASPLFPGNSEEHMIDLIVQTIGQPTDKYLQSASTASYHFSRLPDRTCVALAATFVLPTAVRPRRQSCCTALLAQMGATASAMRLEIRCPAALLRE
jgi:hypothetical protein